MTKKFKFFVCNSSGKILRSSNGHFDAFRKLPPEFTVQDILKEPYFNKTVKERVSHMREGTKLRISQLCGWSGASGGPEYLYIKCIDDSKIEDLRNQLEKVSRNIDSINKEIAKLAGSLMDELKTLNKSQVKIKEQIKHFENTGEYGLREIQ
jgi:septal ring factor EnvC (AmiA/AmiB activator)